MNLKKTFRSRKETTALLLSIAIILLIADLSTRYWYWKDMHLKYDSTVFNNIVTPFATIVSVLFLYLAFAQSRMQNRIASSQNLKENFDKDYETLLRQLNEDVTDSIFNNAQVKSHTNQPMVQVTSLNYISKLKEVIGKMNDDDDYKSDNTNFGSVSGIKTDLNYYLNRSYSILWSYLMVFSRHPVAKYNLVQDFLLRVNDSEMLDSDQDHFKYKVEADILDEYFQFVWHSTNFQVPNMNQENQSAINWITLKDLGFDKYVRTFRQLLKKSS